MAFFKANSRFPCQSLPVASLQGSWSDWEFQAMQRVGPKETMGRRKKWFIQLRHGCVCKLVCIFMYLYILYSYIDILVYADIIYYIYIYIIIYIYIFTHLGRPACVLFLHFVMVCHGQLIETLPKRAKSLLWRSPCLILAVNFRDLLWLLSSKLTWRPCQIGVDDEWFSWFH